MFPLCNTKFEPVVRVNKVQIKMEIDTGATLSIVSEATYKQVWGDNGPTPKRKKIKLHAHTLAKKSPSNVPYKCMGVSARLRHSQGYWMFWGTNWEQFGVSFEKLDLSYAYLQLLLDESAREYLVINTHKGLFEYTR